MENTKLNERVDLFVASLTHDLKDRLKWVENEYRENFDKLSGPIEEIEYQLRSWKSDSEALLDYGKENNFTIVTVQAEAKMEIIKSMDGALFRELGRFGYKSLFDV